MAEPSATGARRVKVYILNDTDTWEERCMGHVRCERDPRSPAYVLKVVAEDSRRIALCSPVRPMTEAAYQMQDDTIISWTEDPLPNSHGFLTEIALSFAEADGCREIWDKLAQINEILIQQRDTHTPNKHILPNNLSTSSQDHHHQQQNQHPVSTHPVLASTLSLPSSIAAPHNSSALDPLVSTGDAAMISASARDNNNLHRSHHSSLVEAPADMTHSSRFFDENLESPSPWGTDPIDDVIFRDNTNVLFLGSPGALVPPAAASDAAVAAGFAMPDPDRAGIEDLYRVMSEQGAIHIHAARERIIAEVSNGDYVAKLCHVFRECESSTDIEGLAMLYHIVRCLFIVGTGSVLEVLVHEKNLMDIVGCLEYDQDHIGDLERTLAEVKRCAAERNAKSAYDQQKEASTGAASDDQQKEACTGAASAISSDKQPNLSDQPSAGAAKDKQVNPGENVGSSAAGLPQEPSKNNDAVKAKATLREENATIRKPDFRTATDAEERELLSRNGKVSTKVQNDKQPSTDGTTVVESSDTNNDIKPESQVQKNLSEETTSSGNLAGDDSERRLIVFVHRDFLERKVSFKSVVPITDQNVVAKIHQNYRVAYIRDVILSRAFDENANSALSGVIVCNNVDIIMYFISGSSALQDLFDRLKSAVEQRRKFGKSSGRQVPQTMPQDDSTIRRNSVDGSRPTKRCSFSDEVCANSRSAPEPVSQKVAKEQNSLSGERSTAKSNILSSARSCVTGSTGESYATAVMDPSTSKDVSSRALGSDRTARNDSATGGPISSESNDDIQVMLGLLRELCSVAKGQQPALKNRFHALLTELGALEVVVSLLLDEDATVRSLCCDILSAAIIHDQTEVRAHILKSVLQREKPDTRRMGIALRSAPVGLQTEVVAARVLLQSKKTDTDVEVSAGPDSAAQEKNNGANESGESVSPKTSVPDSTPSKTGETHKDLELPHAGVQDSKTKCAGPEGPKVSKAEETSQGDVGPDSSGDAATGTETGNARSDNSQSTSADDSAASQPRDPAGGSLPRQAPDKESPSRGVTGESASALPQRDASASQSVKSRQAGEQFPLLAAMMDVVCQDRQGGVALTVLDLLRMLLDPNNMRTQSDREVFLDVFYENFIFRLLVPISECMKTEEDRKEKGLSCGPDGNASHICDLLSFCVTNHAFRGRYFVLGWDAGGRIAKLVEHRRAYIRLSALRFTRACVGMSDEALDRYIMREKLFDPVMKMLGRNGNKDNLISSAVLDVVTFVYHQGRFSLLKHIVDNYSNVLEPTSKYCSAFLNAKKTFDVMRMSNQIGVQHATSHENELGVNGGPEDDSKTHSNVETKTADGTHTDYHKAKGDFESGGPSLRVVSGLLEQEIRTPEDQDNPDKVFARCGPDVPALGDFHSLVERSVSGDAQAGTVNTKSAVGFKEGCLGGKREGLKKVQNRATVDSPERLKSGDAQGDNITKKDNGTLSPEKKRKRKPSLVGYSVEDSDEEDEDGKNRAGRIVPRKGGCSSGGSAGSSGVRLSFSRSGVRRGEVRVAGDYAVGVSDTSETSEDSGSPRKRERSGKVRSSRNGRGRMADGGIETCTRAVMEQQQGDLDELDEKVEEKEEGSPSKRRRTDEAESEAKKVEDSEAKPPPKEEGERSSEVKQSRGEEPAGSSSKQ